MNILLRKARPSDLKDLKELLYEENRYHSELVPEFVRSTRDVLSSEELSEFIDDRNRELFVAQSRADLVGAVIVAIIRMEGARWKKSVETGYVEDLIVTSEFRNRGVGGMLMEKAAEWVRSKGVDSMELHAWEVNRQAVSFYRTAGFQTIQLRMKKDLS